MAAGDLLTADWQVELQGLLTGAGTVYVIPPEGISGLGVAPTKTRDVDLVGRAGGYANPDYEGPRIILIPYLISAADAEDVIDALDALRAAWAPSTVDVELHGQLPGWGHWSVTGRPRGLDVAISHIAAAGVIAAIAEFHALNPAITTGIT